MQGTPSASDVLSRVGETLAFCRSYRDEGERTTVFIHGRWPWNRQTARTRFKTAVRRPDRFFFEYSEVGFGPESEWVRGTVWADSSGTYTWWTLKPTVEVCQSIQHGIGGFAFCSGD